MSVHPLAGKPAPTSILIDTERTLRDFHDRKPDMSDPNQRVSFGTSGHRGASDNATFTEAHIAAIAQAVCDYRKQVGVDGPALVGADTHALSLPAQQVVIEVLAANDVETRIQARDGFTPTPVISHAILTWNRGRASGLADGIIITPSHNPPRDGGIKYNPPNGGPADTDATQWIQDRANQLLSEDNRDVRRIPRSSTEAKTTIREVDFVTPYVDDLPAALDLAAIRDAKLRIGVDPLGGASLAYWSVIADRHGLNIDVVNPRVDPTFAFMSVDHDGQIRMDCSSPYAMAGLVRLKDRYDIAFGADPDSDRHGIVTPTAGLMNPNHYLATAIHYLFTERTDWPATSAVGKTLVSSAIIDRVAESIGRRLYEVPVGFKWFAPGLFDGSLGFGGEESAGASFLRRDGGPWSTDKDGILLCLLAAEITARRGRDPGALYTDLTDRFGAPVYTRIDQPATPAQKNTLKKLSPEAVSANELAGEPILARLTRAPGNDAPIGGLKVVTSNGWFAARPSGTENIYKIYAESFQGPDHLEALVAGAREIVTAALTAAQT